MEDQTNTAPLALTPEVAAALAAPFPDEFLDYLPKMVSQDKAYALAFLDARMVELRLDQVVGPGNWGFTYEVVETSGLKKDPEAERWPRKAARVIGKMTVLGVTRWDAGEADGEDEPLKSAVTDAVKRCGVMFGIGRYLYFLPGKWCPYDKQKKVWTGQPSIDPRDKRRALWRCGINWEIPKETEQSGRPPTPPKKSREELGLPPLPEDKGNGNGTPAKTPTSPATPPAPASASLTPPSTQRADAETHAWVRSKLETAVILGVVSDEIKMRLGVRLQRADLTVADADRFANELDSRIAKENDKPYQPPAEDPDRDPEADAYRTPGAAWIGHEVHRDEEERKRQQGK